MRLRTLLITGCGGDIPIALARIARPFCERLIGTDIHSDHAGPAFFDQCYEIRRANDAQYWESLLEVVEKEDAEAIVLGSEPEIRTAYKAGMDEDWDGVKIIMANRAALHAGLDKFRTAEALMMFGLPAPWTTLGRPRSFPCIYKTQQGSGSRGLRFLAREEDAVGLPEPGYIFQEYLCPDDQEYTCGLYRSRSGEIRTLTFRRWLQGGFTGRGEVVRNGSIDSLLTRLAEALDLRGGINVQLRLTDRGPVVFEINPRFSSTVMFRHKLGFQDFVWSLQEAFGEQPALYTPPPTGTKIYRVSDEVILS